MAAQRFPRVGEQETDFQNNKPVEIDRVENIFEVFNFSQFWGEKKWMPLEESIVSLSSLFLQLRGIIENPKRWNRGKLQLRINPLHYDLSDGACHIQ